MASEEKVREVKSRHSARLLNQPGVSGVGVERDENGEYVLAVHVDSNDPEVADSIPETIEGCKVKVVRSGPFRKFQQRRE